MCLSSLFLSKSFDVFFSSSVSFSISSEMSEHYCSKLLKDTDRGSVDNTQTIGNSMNDQFKPYVYSCKPFVPHPISKGVDFRRFNAAFNYRREMRRVSEKIFPFVFLYNFFNVAAKKKQNTSGVFGIRQPSSILSKHHQSCCSIFTNTDSAARPTATVDGGQSKQHSNDSRKRNRLRWASILGQQSEEGFFACFRRSLP